MTNVQEGTIRPLREYKLTNKTSGINSLGLINQVLQLWKISGQIQV